jgi:hypothetical protein
MTTIDATTTATPPPKPTAANPAKPKRKAKSQRQPEPSPKRTGRPPKLVADERTLHQLRNLAAIQATVREAAGILMCGVSTLEAFIGAGGAKEARDAWEQGRQQGRVSLRRKQYQMAMNGSVTMAIFLGKQRDWLGQADRIEQTSTVDATISTTNIQVLETPDLASMADRKAALFRFEAFRRQLAAQPPPAPAPVADAA